MHSDLLELGWTEEHMNRIEAVVTEEAQKARVAAQVLPLVGPIDPTVVSVPPYTLFTRANPRPLPPRTARDRLAVNSDPTLNLTKIAINVYVRHREAADPELNAALTMFRRAANYIARIEDALVFNGRPAGAGAWPMFGVLANAIPTTFTLTGRGPVQGLLPMIGPFGRRVPVAVLAQPGVTVGDQVVNAIINSINRLDANGQLGPYACVLDPFLFAAICAPNANLIMPRDRILPFLQGPLLRSSALPPGIGVVIALSGNPVELVVARDIKLRYLQTTEEPRLVFQVAEKVALRIKESAALSILF